MKKSTRILSLLMALMMLLGTFSVMGSAYKAFKGDAVNFDDIDAATFTTEQYASMGLDEVDRMLAEEQLSVYIYIGTLDVTSIDNAVASVESLLDSVSALLSMLGDAKNLSIESLRGKRRSASAGTYATDADLEIVYSVFDFLYDNAGILENYANGSLSLGILNSFVAEYVFNVRELLTGLIFGATEAGKKIDYDYFDDGTTGIPTEYLNPNNGVLNLLQGLVNDLLLGTWEKLDPYFDNPYDEHIEVIPGFYEFKDAAGNDVSDQAIDTNAYDYYGWVHPDCWVTVGLGGAKRVAPGVVPAADYELLDITGDVKAYDFIEALLQRAFNYILVPVLNRDTAPWLKEECGYEFPDQYTKKEIYDEATQSMIPNPDYVENFPGIKPEGIEDNILYQLFETDNLKIEKVEIPAGTTLVSNLNDILGDFVKSICKYAPKEQVSFKGGTYSWDWTYGSNNYLFDNICNVAKFVLELTGNEFFGSTIKTKSADEIALMNNQQVVSYVIRAILNSSVDWMYISDDYQTVAEVGYAAVEQLGWQDIPQITYTKPVKGGDSDEVYYGKLIDKALTILLDVAAFRLNQEFDMNSANGSNPKAGEGLIPYQGDTGSYINNVIMVAEWAIQTYGPALALNLNLASSGSHSEADVWNDLDTILNSIIPFKGSDSILASSISGNTYVFKSLVFDNILKPVYTLNAENFVKLFDRNENGILATDNGIEVIITILTKVFDLLFPGVFKKGVTTLDGILVNSTLGTMIYDLASEFGRNAASRTGKTNGVQLVSRTTGLVYVALPIVCQVLGLSDDQEFGELENYMPRTISKDSKLSDGVTTGIEFLIYNGSSGINTGYTSQKTGQTTKDKSYTYEITQIYAKGYKKNAQGTMVESNFNPTSEKTVIPAGESSKVTFTGFSDGMVVAFYIVYNVTDETGKNMTSSALTNTTYAYVGAASKDDDAIEKVESVGNKKLKYESEIYISTGASLSKVSDYTLRFEDSKENAEKDGETVTGTVTVNSVSINSTTYPFAIKNTDSGSNTASFIGKGGTYFVKPFEIAKKGDGSEYARFKNIYDEEGEIIGNNGGVEAGDYEITTNLNVGGTQKSIKTTVHIYDDYGLDGAFEKAVAMNRQSTNYDKDKNNGAAAGLWNTYVDALKNAATIALKPKTGSTFQSDIYYAPNDYDNLYEKYAVELQDAIDALKPYELSSGTSAIENELNKPGLSGFNYDVVTVDGYKFKIDRDWTDPNYIYFGYEDFVPHTYNRYKAARNSALDLIDSQEYYCSADILIFDETTSKYIINPDASDSAKATYAKEKAAAAAYNAPIINAVSAEYATHMVKLMGERLIPLDADKSKLNIVRGFAVKDANKSYTKSSLDAFTKARDFADTVAADSSTTLRPSKVKKAMSELVEAWKELEEGADYSGLDAALSNTDVTTALGAGLPGEQVVYSDESFNAFYEAYENALAIKAQGLGKTDDNQAKIDAAASELLAKCAALAAPGSDAVSFDFDTSVVFTTTTGIVSNNPIVDDQFIDDWGYAAPELNGEAVKHLLYGVGEWNTEDQLASIFANIKNGSVEVAASPYGDYGTGAVIYIKDNSGSVVDSYMVCLRGDMDGSNTIEVSDDDEILYYYNYMGIFNEMDPETSWMFFGADATGDGFVGVDDSEAVGGYYNYLWDICQTEAGTM